MDTEAPTQGHDLHEEQYTDGLQSSVMPAERIPGLLQPGTRPVLNDQTVIDLVHQLWGLTVTELEELPSYEDLNVHVLVRECHTHPKLQTVSSQGYVFKALNPQSSTPHADGEVELMRTCWQLGFNVPEVLPTIGGDFNCRVQIPTNLHPEQHCLTHPPGLLTIHDKGDEQGKEYVLRLSSYIPGSMMSRVTCTDDMLQQLGSKLGRYHKAFIQSIPFPGLKHLWNIVNLRHLSLLRNLTHLVQNNNHRNLVLQIIKVFEANVKPALDDFQTGAVHGDVSDTNVLVSPRDDTYDVTGLIDFRHCSHDCIVFDVAIAIMYQLLRPNSDMLSVGRHIISGYGEHIVLQQSEISALPILVAGRFLQSLLIGLYAASNEPDNPYLTRTQRQGWLRLEQLWNTPHHLLLNAWT